MLEVRNRRRKGKKRFTMPWGENWIKMILQNKTIISASFVPVCLREKNCNLAQNTHTQSESNLVLCLQVLPWKTKTTGKAWRDSCAICRHNFLGILSNFMTSHLFLLAQRRAGWRLGSPFVRLRDTASCLPTRVRCLRALKMHGFGNQGRVLFFGWLFFLFLRAANLLWLKS